MNHAVLKYLSIFLILSVMMMGATMQIAAQVFDFQGHRGCRGLMPENTVAAMLKAIDLGVTTLEMDLAITTDGEVIVTHDPHFSHLITTTPEGRFLSSEMAESLSFYQHTWAAIRKYDIGMKGHPGFPVQQKMKAHIPLLLDLIQAVKKHCKKKAQSPSFL